MNERDPGYLRHIIEAISQIQLFSKDINSAAELRDNALPRAGIERMLTVIGEAAKPGVFRIKRKTSGGPMERDLRDEGQNYSPLFWCRLRGRLAYGYHRYP